jgi:hypothetical protein
MRIKRFSFHLINTVRYCGQRYTKGKEDNLKKIAF